MIDKIYQENITSQYSLYSITAWVKQVTRSVLVEFVPPLSPSCPVSPHHHPSPPQKIWNGTCLISPQRSLNFHQIGSNQTVEWRVIPLRCPWFPASSAASQPWGGSDQSNYPNEDEQNNSKEEQKKKKMSLRLNWIHLENHYCSLKCKTWGRGRQELRLPSILAVLSHLFPTVLGKNVSPVILASCESFSPALFWRFCFIKSCQIIKTMRRGRGHETKTLM